MWLLRLTTGFANVLRAKPPNLAIGRAATILLQLTKTKAQARASLPLVVVRLTTAFVSLPTNSHDRIVTARPLV